MRRRSDENWLPFRIEFAGLLKRANSTTVFLRAEQAKKNPVANGHPISDMHKLLWSEAIFAAAAKNVVYRYQCWIGSHLVQCPPRSGVIDGSVDQGRLYCGTHDEEPGRC